MNRTSKIHGILLLFMFLESTTVCRCEAQEEPPVGANLSGITVGCAEPAAPKNAFYVDPVNGSMKGNGSESEPWRTLAEVFAARLVNGADNTHGKVHAGDVVYLLTGNHGSLNLQSPAYANTDFIRIEAAPGHTPVIEGLVGMKVSKWVFKGITFQSVKKLPDWCAIVYLRPATDIIFTENTIYSQPDSVATQWTPEDWANSASLRGAAFDGTSISVINNTIKNVQVGLSAGGERILIDHNLIQYFSADGIDFYLSNSQISRNRIVDHYPFSKDGLHSDGMQGQGQKGAPVYTNLAILNNVVIEATGAYDTIPLIPTSKGRNVMQGICTFDGDWSHVTIANNAVSVSAHHGIAFYGTQDSLLINNTVVKQSSDPKINPWIAVAGGKSGRVPTGNVIRNNISPTLSLPKDVAVTCDHNLIFAKTWQAEVTKKSLIVSPHKVLVQHDPAKGPLDFHLTGNSPAIGKGNPESAPETDIIGRVRDRKSIDLGAYCYACPEASLDVSPWNAGVSPASASAKEEKTVTDPKSPSPEE